MCFALEVHPTSRNFGLLEHCELSVSGAEDMYNGLGKRQHKHCPLRKVVLAVQNMVQLLLCHYTTCDSCY